MCMHRQAGWQHKSDRFMPSYYDCCADTLQAVIKHCHICYVPPVRGTGVISPQRAQRTFCAPCRKEYCLYGVLHKAAFHKLLNLPSSSNYNRCVCEPEGIVVTSCSLHTQYCSEGQLQVTCYLSSVL